MKRFVYTMVAMTLALAGMPQAYAQFDLGGVVKGAVQGVSDAVEKSGVIEKSKELAREVMDTKEEPKQSASDAQMSKVAAALEKAGYLNENKAKPNAKYYIFLYSASWCGPCKALMPKVVKEYKKSIRKDDSVSLILVGRDRTEAACKKYLEHYRTDMPGLDGCKHIDLPGLPRMNLIPSAFITDADGKVLKSGHGSIVLDWEKHVSDKNSK